VPNDKGFVDSSAEAAVGGYQGIKKVRGLQVSLEKKPPRDFEGEQTYTPKEQIEVKLEDAIILEMFPDADDMELTDGKFTCWVPYAAEGKLPHKNSTYMVCFVGSSEELGEKEEKRKVRPSERNGTYVTLERQDRLLFKTKVKNKETDEMETKEMRSANPETGIPYSSAWCYVADEAADAESVVEYITGLVIGLNEKAALRKLTMDNKAKQFPEYKEACKAGTLPDLLDVELVDDKFERTNAD